MFAVDAAVWEDGEDGVDYDSGGGEEEIACVILLRVTLVSEVEDMIFLDMTRHMMNGLGEGKETYQSNNTPSFEQSM